MASTAGLFLYSTCPWYASPMCDCYDFCFLFFFFVKVAPLGRGNPAGCTRWLTSSLRGIIKHVNLQSINLRETEPNSWFIYLFISFPSLKWRAKVIFWYTASRPLNGRFIREKPKWSTIVTYITQQGVKRTPCISCETGARVGAWQ